MHATAVVYGECGVLIAGPSGSGKSALALALLARASDLGVYAALVGDDRVWARSVGDRLVASGSPELAGFIERRAAGLIRSPHEPAAVIGLFVELSEFGRTWPRLPDQPDLVAVEGVRVSRLALDSDQSASDQALAVDERLGFVDWGNVKRKGISLEHCAAVHKNGSPTGAWPVRRTPEA